MKDYYWGDTDIDWKKLGEAMNYFVSILEKWGRMQISWKEKYGSLRIGHGLYDYSLLQLFDRGYCQWRGESWNTRIRLSNRFQKIERWLSRVFMKEVLAYKRLIFNFATLFTIRKYPEFKDEICWEFDFEKLLYKWTKRKIKYCCYWQTSV